MSSDAAMTAVSAALHRYDAYLLTCHVNPDPDCLGSMLALAAALKRMGKAALCVSEDPVRPEWRFMVGAEDILAPDQVQESFPAMIVLDCALDRTGAVAARAGQAQAVINIDHHVTNPGSGTVNLIDPSAAAVGEIIYDLLVHLGLQPTAEEATCLYAAIMTDTGSFRFSNTTAKSLDIAARLVHIGARPHFIAENVYETQSWESTRLLASALGTLDRTADGQVAWLSVTREMLRSSGAREREADGFIQYPRQVRGVEVALIFRELESQEVRVGLRSKGRVDVSQVAESLGGGGHPRAAGCTVQGSLDVARTKVLQAVQHALEGAGVR